jgi:hypothetical protein
MLRLNLSVKPTAKPNRLGVLAGDLQGFPNGRRLTDDVVDIELQALEGAAQTGKLVSALAAGDGVNANDHAFGTSFPYVALPNVGAVNNGTSASNASQSSAAAAVTSPRSAPPAERSVRTAPVANSAPDDTMNTVVTATLGAVAFALASLLITGWLMRRRRPTAAGTPQNPPPPPAASGPDESPA